MKKDKSLEDNKLSNIAPKLGRVDTKSALFLVGLSAFLTGGAIAFATFYGRLVVFGEQPTEKVAQTQKSDKPLVSSTPAATKPKSKLYLSVSGFIQPEGKVVAVTAPVGERVLSTLVREGDYVRRGQVVAYLSSYEKLKAQLDYVSVYYSSVENSKPGLALAVNENSIQTKNTSKRELPPANSSNPQQFPNLTSTSAPILTPAEAAKNQAIIRYHQAQLEQGIVRAPRDGQVLKVLVRPGDYVRESGVLLQGNTSKMFVVASVPLQNIQKVKLGSVANISSSALSKPVLGKVTGVGKLVTTDASGNSYLDVSVKIGDYRQVANMSNLPVRVDIEIPN